jgi:hypothetical protein
MLPGRFVQSATLADLLQYIGESLNDLRPIVLGREPGRGPFILLAKADIAYQGEDRIRKHGWIVSQDQIATALYIQTFCADGSGDQGLTHCHGFENLQAGSSSDAQRHDDKSSIAKILGYRGYSARDLNMF